MGSGVSRAAGEVRIMRGSSVARRARSWRCCPITAGSSLSGKNGYTACSTFLRVKRVS